MHEKLCEELLIIEFLRPYDSRDVLVSEERIPQSVPELHDKVYDKTFSMDKVKDLLRKFTNTTKKLFTTHKYSDLVKG
jgi:hypothetical protein